MAAVELTCGDAEALPRGLARPGGGHQPILPAQDVLGRNVGPGGERGPIARSRCPGRGRRVGYDDSDLAEALDLTSVRQPFAETGRIAISLPFDAMDGTSAST